MNSQVSRRTFIKVGAAGAGLLATAACAPQVVEKIVKETVVVTEEKEKVVEKQVTTVVEKVIEKAVEPTKEPVVLRFHIRAGNEINEAAIYATRPQEFTEETGIKVELEGIPGGEFMAKLEILSVSGTLGDNTFTTQASWHHSRLVHFGILLPMNDWMASAGIKREEWLPGAIDTLTFDGQVYGLARTSHPAEAYLFFNHQLFEEAGIEVPKLDLEAEKAGKAMTWEQLFELGTKLSKGPADAREVYGFFPVTTNSQAVVNGIRSFGGWELDERGKEHPVDDAWKNYIGWNYKVLVEDKLAPHATELGSTGVIGVFAAGKIAIMQHMMVAHWALRDAVGPADGSGKFAWSAVGMPQGPNTNLWGSSVSTSAPTRQSKHPVEACMLQYALADARLAYLVANELGYLVGRTDEMSEIGPAADNPWFHLQWAHHLRSAPYRIGQNYRGEEWRAALTNTLDELYLGTRPLDDGFYAYAKGALDEILMRPVA